MVDKAVLPYATWRVPAPGAERPCASATGDASVGADAQRQSKQGLSKKREPAVSLSDRSGGDGSGPQHPH